MHSLQQRSRQQAARLEVAGISGLPPAAPETDIGVNIDPDVPRSNIGRPGSVPELDSPIAHLTLAAMAEDRDTQHPHSFTLRSAISAVSSCNGSMLTSTADIGPLFPSVFGHVKGASLGEILSTIPNEQAAVFINRYLDVLHPIFPWSDHSAIMALYWRVLSGTADPHHQMEEVVMGIVLALGMDASGGHGHDSRLLAQKISEHAGSCFAAASVERDKLLEVQSLLLLSILSFYHPEVGLTWHYVGLALSCVISRGFHREPPVREYRSSLQKPVNCERSLFWSTYCLDR